MSAVLVPVTASPGQAVAVPERAAADETTHNEALAQAEATGQRVEVETETTETNQLFALPGGAFELEAHRDPVRTDIHGDWEPIDTTLEVNSDGTIEPKAITLPVAFADGGTNSGEAIVTAGQGEETLSFAWDEGPLPEPVVSGNQVTYPEVRPGVDLVFSAHATGYSDALVVHTPAAATALQQDPIAFTGTSPGLDLSTAADGTLVATTDNGEQALLSPPPIAWDSSGGGEGVNEPDAADSGSGVVHELAQPEITEADAAPESSMTVEVTPPTSMTQDPDTEYPIFLDPQISGRYNSRFRTVHSNGWNYGTPSTEFMRVGYCDWSTCNSSLQGNARSYFEFDVSALTSGEGSDPTVFYAKVQAQQVWNASSAAQPVNLRRSGNFSNSTTYPGPVGAQLEQISSAAGNDNNPGWLNFDNASVATYVEEEAAAEQSLIQFALSAPYEGNKYFWKKFSNDTKLTVHFMYTPKVTSYLSTNTVECDGAVYSRGDLDATVHVDRLYGGDHDLDYALQVFKTDTTNDGPWDSSTLVKSTGWQDGAYSSFVGHITGLPDGRHAWRTSIKAIMDVSKPDGSSYPDIIKNTDPAVRPFIVDSVPPAQPVISSDDYPEGYWGRSDTNPGTFQIQIPTAAEGIAYAFNGEPPEIADSDCAYTGTGRKPRSAATNGVITLPIANANPGVPNKLTVVTFDKAHNPSDPVTYEYYVSPDFDGTTATNRLEAEGSSFTRHTDTPTAVTINGAVSGAGAPQQNLTIGSTDSAATAELSFQVTQPGYYAFGAAFSDCATCGHAEITVASGQALSPITINTGQTARTYSRLGGYKLVGTPAQPGTYKITVRLPQATPETPAQVQLDYITMAQIQGGLYGEAAATLQESLALAFNNNGIGTAGETGVALEPKRSATDTTDALWKEKLNAAGITQGASFTTSFSNTSSQTVTNTFQIPAETAAGKDNVIAAGQRIAIPGPVAVKHVDFLVAATCGTVTAKPAIAFDFVHGPPTGPNTTTNPSIGSNPVSDWQLSQPTGTFLTPIAVSGRMSGSPAVGSNAEVGLYVLEVDVDPNQVANPLREVGLPSTGASLTNDCSVAPRLHVLAMATRP